LRFLNIFSCIAFQNHRKCSKNLHGEITSSQENAWQKTLEVFDADSGKYEQKLVYFLRLFEPEAILRQAGLPENYPSRPWSKESPACR